MRRNYCSSSFPNAKRLLLLCRKGSLSNADKAPSSILKGSFSSMIKSSFSDAKKGSFSSAKKAPSSMLKGSFSNVERLQEPNDRTR